MKKLPEKELTASELADVLESGRYSKTTGSLADGYGYCCLGVYASECGFLQFGDCEEGYVDDGNYASEADLGPMAPAWMQEVAPFAYNSTVRQPIEGRLMSINDSSPSWTPVIDFLRSL